ncbi:hypothetical protein RJ639_031948, partial [Escallonia herrerae]
MIIGTLFTVADIQIVEAGGGFYFDSRRTYRLLQEEIRAAKLVCKSEQQRYEVAYQVGLPYSFAGTFSEKVTRSVRQFSPHLAAKMRPPLTPVIRGRPSAKRAIHICGRPRWLFVFVFSSVSFILWFVSCGLLTVLWALGTGLLATILHASFRTPNLKARLNTFREEFRAVWRNYSE